MLKRIGTCLLALLWAACGGPNTNDGGPPGEKSLQGVAAVGAPIAGLTLTFKDATGATATAVTAADGSYSLRTTALTFPVLLRIDSPQGPLFSSAFASGVTNVHPFTNLVVRNWYKVQGIDVDGAFSGTQPLAVPSAAEIETIKAVVAEVIGAMLAEAGIDPQSFDLFNSPFQADGTGLDRVLDRTEVTFDPASNGVTIATSDPVTGLPAELNLDLSKNLGREDTTAPSLPANLEATVAGENAIVLTWTPSTDDVAVSGYHVYRGGTLLARSPYPTFKDARLQRGTEYCYAVEAVDAKGNVSARTAAVCARTLTAADVTAPSTPPVLNAAEQGDGKVTLSWPPSTDENGVLGYRVFRAGVVVATVSVPRFVDEGLTAGTDYCYKVVAFDAAGNTSAPSAELCITTSSSGLAKAYGTYTFAAGTLTLDTEFSSGCNGPEAGRADVIAVAMVADTWMAWNRESGDPMVWLRDGSGTDGDLVGTWRRVEEGREYVLQLRADGDWTLDWDPGTCGATRQGSAQGTYTYAASTLTVDTKESTNCNGPVAGTVVAYAVSAFTATSMTWTAVEDATNTLVWTRPGGTAGDLVGTWTMTKDGRGYTLTTRADGTWSLTWDAGTCDEEPPPTIANGAQGYYSYQADVITFDPQVAQSCNEQPAWLAASFTVGGLTETSMTWTLLGTTAGPTLTWTRAEPGAGVLGLWEMTEGDRRYVLSLIAEGTFSVTWNGPCDAPDVGGANVTAGRYDYASGTLSLTVEEAASNCPAFPFGLTEFSVTESTADYSMTWSNPELGTITWYRGGGEPIEGNLAGQWSRTVGEGAQDLIFQPDGSFQIYWSGMSCPPDSVP